MPKWTKDDGSVRTNIFHSYLVREGRTMVKLKGPPRESKYKKGSASHYIYLQVPDDETEYCLAVEPETVNALDKAPKDKWLYLTAYGSATEPASIVVEDDAGPVFDGGDDYEPPPDAPVQATVTVPPPLWPGDSNNATQGAPTKPTTPTNGIVGKAVGWTVEAVQGLEAHGIRVDSDAAARIYNTHFIQASR